MMCNLYIYIYIYIYIYVDKQIQHDESVPKHVFVLDGGRCAVDKHTK